MQGGSPLFLPQPERLLQAEPLPQSFFRLPASTLAPMLLGRLLCHEDEAGLTGGLIVEAEAYAGPADRAAHSYGNRRTPRTEIMYSAGGHAYVFPIYGLYHCFNVVAAQPGQPEAVLIRALQPVVGVDAMQRRRGTQGRPDRLLTSGPGRLCQALGINRRCNGLPLYDPDSSLRLLPGVSLEPQSVACGPRIGIDYAAEWREVPWRFWLAGNPWVSRP